jgi:hypothetical protein
MLAFNYNFGANFDIVIKKKKTVTQQILLYIFPKHFRHPSFKTFEVSEKPRKITVVLINNCDGYKTTFILFVFLFGLRRVIK